MPETSKQSLLATYQVHHTTGRKSHDRALSPFSLLHSSTNIPPQRILPIVLGQCRQAEDSPTHSCIIEYLKPAVSFEADEGDELFIFKVSTLGCTHFARTFALMAAFYTVFAASSFSRIDVSASLLRSVGKF